MPKRDASTSRRPIDAAKFELPASATRAAASIRWPTWGWLTCGSDWENAYSGQIWSQWQL